jgi:hypothetical protein
MLTCSGPCGSAIVDAVDALDVLDAVVEVSPLACPWELSLSEPQPPAARATPTTPATSAAMLFLAVPICVLLAHAPEGRCFLVEDVVSGGR